MFIYRRGNALFSHADASRAQSGISSEYECSNPSRSSSSSRSPSPSPSPPPTSTSNEEESSSSSLTSSSEENQRPVRLHEITRKRQRVMPWLRPFKQRRLYSPSSDSSSEDAEEDAQVVPICEPVVQTVSNDNAVVPVALNMLRRIPSPVSSSSREARMSSSSDEESTGSEDVWSS